MSFSKIFLILFIVGSTSSLLILPECLNNSWRCFSPSFLDFKDRRRVFLQILSVFAKIRDSSLLPSSNFFFDCENSFHPSGAIQEYFQFDYPEPIILDLFIPSLSSRSNQFMISLFSCILISQVSSFVF